MCHGYTPDWSEIETEEETDDEPDFLNDESDTEVELVTDGGE
jgi:hypothetical protein